MTTDPLYHTVCHTCAADPTSEPDDRESLTAIEQYARLAAATHRRWGHHVSVLRV